MSTCTPKIVLLPGRKVKIVHINSNGSTNRYYILLYVYKSDCFQPAVFVNYTANCNITQHTHFR